MTDLPALKKKKFFIFLPQFRVTLFFNFGKDPNCQGSILFLKVYFLKVYLIWEYLNT